MAERHLSICDRCGRTENMPYGGIGDYSPPEGWEKTDVGLLCPPCHFDYQDFLKGFATQPKEENEK